MVKIFVERSGFKKVRNKYIYRGQGLWDKKVFWRVWWVYTVLQTCYFTYFLFSTLEELIYFLFI